jgi:hypothetical protein
MFGIEFNMNMYVFRKTAISNAIFVKGYSESLVAQYAGTSVAMLDKHYARDISYKPIEL